MNLENWNLGVLRKAFITGKKKRKSEFTGAASYLKECY